MTGQVTRTAVRYKRLKAYRITDGKWQPSRGLLFGARAMIRNSKNIHDPLLDIIAS